MSECCRTMRKKSERLTIGWREWVALPDLGVEAVKAKIDTGARTSAIHAYKLAAFEREGRRWIRFRLHPVQRHRIPEILCETPVLDERVVTDSGGSAEKRYVIETTLRIGSVERGIEMTLTRRDNMQFRMLLGRTAISKGFLVSPGQSFLMGRELANVYEGRSE